MALEALASNDLSNFIIYDTISATTQEQHYCCNDPLLLDNSSSCNGIPFPDGVRSVGNFAQFSAPLVACRFSKTSEPARERQNSSAQGRKKRRRRPRTSVNKEDAESQRITHITVERNRRKQMNEHLSVLRSLMPESYIQRGDQASIVGGAINFVKELEQLLQSLESQKRALLLQQQRGDTEIVPLDDTNNNNNNKSICRGKEEYLISPPFAQFFSYPQYCWCHVPSEYSMENPASVADIEVTLIETHANLRIMSKRRPRQLAKMVSGFQALSLTLLHLNVTTLDPFVLYSISAKVEEGCQLNSVDEIAGSVHHMLTLIAEEASLC